MFKIGDYLTPETYALGAIWATANNAVINPLTWQIEARPEPTKEEIQALRSEAYKAEVDPITCNIQRLGDEEQTAEIIAEIAELVEERRATVESIKQRYPYPAEPIEASEEPLVELSEASEDVVELYSMEI